MKAYFTDRNVRRAFVLALFVSLLAFFRHLFVLAVFFVVFERVLGSLAERVQALTRLQFKWCVLIVVGALAAALGIAIYAGIEALIADVPRIRQSAREIHDVITQSQQYRMYRDRGFISAEDVVRQARDHAGTAMGLATALGRNVLYVFIALVFAVVFLLERDELEHWRESIAADSVPRILLRYMGHASDAIAITLKLQLIVSVVSAAITLPILLILRLPGIPALVALLLVTGLIPVVGEPMAGVVLMVLAYITRGPVGLGVFMVSTFVLHKLESYYLNPRLTAKHVKLPSFVIIVSLVLFEHAFGLVGVFLSFPCLYVAAKIRAGWVDPDAEARDEAERGRALREILPKLRGFKVHPVAVTTAAETTDRKVPPPTLPAA